jgi:hypothetical protein
MKQLADLKVISAEKCQEKYIAMNEAIDINDELQVNFQNLLDIYDALKNPAARIIILSYFNY